MIRRPPRSTLSSSSAASDVYKRQGDVIRHLGGLHRFVAWDRPILTDSGGYQVMSLAGSRKLSEEGVLFRSPVDGSAHFLSPERAVALQLGDFGVDVAMVLDECT